MVLSLIALRRHPRHGVASPTLQPAQPQQALHLRNRLQQLLEMRGSSSPKQVSFVPCFLFQPPACALRSHDIGKEIRDAKTYEKKCCAKLSSLHSELLIVLCRQKGLEKARQARHSP